MIITYRLVSEDQKFLVTGKFANYNHVVIPALVRLNSIGTLDTTFISPADTPVVKSSCIQGDGSIWIGGMDRVHRWDLLVEQREAVADNYSKIGIMIILYTKTKPEAFLEIIESRQTY